MKKIVLVCLAVLCVTALASQAWASGVGIKVGYSLAKIHETQGSLTLDWENLSYVTGGLTFESGWGMLSLVPEVLYVQQGGEFNVGTSKVRDRYSYIQVPVQLKVTLIQTGMVRPFVAGGVYGAYLLRAENIVKVGGVTDKLNITADFNRWDWGAVGSVGLGFHHRTMTFTVEGRYNFGFVNILNSPAAGDSIKNRCWMALVGVSY